MVKKRYFMNKKNTINTLLLGLLLPFTSYLQAVTFTVNGMPVNEMSNQSENKRDWKAFAAGIGVGLVSNGAKIKCNHFIPKSLEKWMDETSPYAKPLSQSVVNTATQIAQEGIGHYMYNADFDDQMALNFVGESLLTNGSRHVCITFASLKAIEKCKQSSSINTHLLGPVLIRSTALIGKSIVTADISKKYIKDKNPSFNSYKEGMVVANLAFLGYVLSKMRR